MSRASRPPRHLQPEEKALWKKVTTTVTPLAPVDVEPETQPDLAAELAEALNPKTDHGKPVQQVPAPRPQAAIRKPAQRRPEPVIDRPVYRKLARGRLPIDATLDLHHMNQDEAHARLQGFLHQAQALGHRHVLVITGKGSSPSSEGILRRMVPVWLDTLTFSALVSGYQSAARGHGGEGAFYIRIRRRREPGEANNP